MRKRSVLLALCTLVFGAIQAESAEYFVGKNGNDTNNGQSREDAFLTIQKGVNVLKPGDTLTIGRGEYFENVTRANLGNDSADTVIRAEIAGTVTLRGDVAAPEFEKVEGYRFIYSAPFDQVPKAVLERDTLDILTGSANMRELEFEPGSFFYDAGAKRLYISSSDLRPLDQHHYTVAVKGEKGKSGLMLQDPKRVVIEGLAMVGYFPAWGIDLMVPVSCVIRDCVTYMNMGGIVLGQSGAGSGGMKNLVERCVSYGNRFSGISRYYANNDIIRNCYTYKNANENGENFGIMHYHSMSGPLMIKNNISWGQRFDYSVKPSAQERLENNVALGSVRNAKMFSNLIGGGNEYDRASKAPADNILFVREQKLDRNLEFADPLNMDFRLQPDSRFRKSDPEGRDRGSYPYEKNIFYVASSGNDGADGLSMHTAWRTPGRAFKDLKPGDTVYLEEGMYQSAKLSAGKADREPVCIRGRGRGLVVFVGRMDVDDSANVAFERLAFAAGVAVDGSRDVAFKNCSFSGNGLAVQGAEGLRVTHCVFAGRLLQLKKSAGVYLSGNIFANAKGAAVALDTADAVRYSDYNSYQNETLCWTVNGQKWPLSTVRAQHDHYSLVITPELSRRKGAAIVDNVHLFKGRGPHATALGIYRENESQALHLVGPFLHSVTDTTANIEWWTSAPANYNLAWGETPVMKNTVSPLRLWDHFITYSLTGLKPGTTYYFRIISAKPSGGEGSDFLPALDPEKTEISFKIAPSADEAVTYHVGPGGNDKNDGRSREKAFRTVSHAAYMVKPGDMVLIGEGTYDETVRIRATGEKGRPITFRSMPYEKVTFVGRRRLITILLWFILLVPISLSMLLGFSDRLLEEGVVEYC